MNNVYIGSYYNAKAFYESTKPIRGHGPDGYRPLGDRKDHHRARLVRDGDTYILRFWNTDIGRYYMDGEVEHLDVTTAGYNTNTTREFMGQTLDISLKRRAHQLGWMMLGPLRGEYYYDGSRKMKFIRDAVSRDWILTNPQPAPYRVLDKELARGARAEVAEFLKYAKIMTDITAGKRCCDQEWNGYTGRIPESSCSVSDLANHSGDIEYYYELMRRLTWDDYTHLKKNMYSHLYSEKGVYKIVTEGDDVVMEDVE